MYARNLFEPTKVSDISSVVPLESDALVVEFLARHGYDSEYAKAHLLALLAVGKGKNYFLIFFRLIMLVICMLYIYIYICNWCICYSSKVRR